MTTASRHLTSGDFLLLGSSVAVLVILCWPVQSARQWVEIRMADGHHQRYIVSIDDPRLHVLKRRLDRWEHPTSSRALRTARWYQAVADYYHHLEKGVAPSEVAQVSFVAAGHANQAANQRSFWLELSKQAQIQIAKANQDLHLKRAGSAAPVRLGPVVDSIRSTWAYPVALLSALLIVLLFKCRQRARPPIELACDVDPRFATTDSRSIQLRIPASWVRIHQPLEVLFWQATYRTVVVSAAICLWLIGLN